MLEIKGDLKTLYQQSTTDRSNIDDETSIKIKKIFKNVKRKYKMAKLLNSSGFVDESLSPFCEMVKISFEILDLLKSKVFDDDFVNAIKNSENVESDYIVLNSKKFYSQLKSAIKTL